MRLTFIDISDILRQQSNIMQAVPGNKWLFHYLPLCSGLLFSFLFYEDTEKVLNVLTLFLSIFIPIFISFLATLISFVMNKIITRHNKERVPLIKETFYNICYLIPVSLLLLLLSLLMYLSMGKGVEINVWKINTTLHQVFLTIIGTLFYGGIIHIMLNLLMVTKRIFKLFDKEIDLLTSGIDVETPQEPSTSQPDAPQRTKDVNALDNER